MLARRIIAVSADKAFGRQLATACRAAGGTVDTHQALDELGKGELSGVLLVLHLAGELATAAAELAPRLTGDARVIAILPQSNLAAVVDLMQSSDRIAGVMIAEQLDARELSAMVTRVLAGDLFGIEKLLRWGTQVHSALVGDYQEKSLCIAQISEFAELMGVRRKYRESIEQCIDEMLMNALYDAPVDDQGKQIFAEIPTKTRISLRVEQKVVVQYACDGKQFVVSVRDAFGTLERSTVLRYLHKCLHADQQIDRKAGGAGLGLYLMVNSASTVYFNVLPGVATEAQCVFDLEVARLQLAHLGFFVEKIDASGRLANGPSRRLPAGASHPVERRRAPAPPPPPRGLIAALSVAIVATLALIAVAAWPRLVGGKHLRAVTFTTIPPGATIELEGRNVGTARGGTLVVGGLEVGRAYPVVVRLDGYQPRQGVVQPHEGDNQVTFELQPLAATVQLDSQPSGARVMIDGKPAGTTPLAIDTLAPGSSVTVAFEKTGYHATTTTLAVPRPGEAVRLVEPLQVADELARVHVVSAPPGAQVVLDGHLLAAVTTPADVLVEAGKPARFELRLPHHVPALLDPFTPPPGGDGIEKRATLVPGVTVQLAATLPGTATVSRAPHCRDLELPAACVLAPGSYTITFTAAPPVHARVRHTIKVAHADRSETFELGLVVAGPGKHLELPGGQATHELALAPGPHTVTVGDEHGTHAAKVRVPAGGKAVAN